MKPDITTTYKHRLLENKLKKVAANFPVVVLTGARQVGKTTLLEHLFPQAQKITFDPIIDIANARKEPELFLDNINKPVLLDEIQYAPELIPVIKRRVDENRTPGQYLLTGSQNLQLLKNIAESLAGRAAILSLLPMSFAEANNQPTSWLVNFLQDPQKFLTTPHEKISRQQSNLNSTFATLWRGAYPGLIDKDNEIIQIGLGSYFQTYIERDVRLLSEVSDLHEFTRFIQLLANLTAQEINFSQLGREIGISPHTAEKWLNILINTNQWFSIQPFANNPMKRLSERSKGYFNDTGMACHLMYISSPLAAAGHPRLGALFETFVAQEILKQIAVMPTQPGVFHWRCHSGSEVDLLLEIDNWYFPIEIKCKSLPQKKDTFAIKAFREAYPSLNIAPGIVIAPCENIMPLGNDCYMVPYNLLK